MSARPLAPPGDLDEGEAAAQPARHTRAGAGVAALFTALPFVAMGGAVALPALVGLTGAIGAPWLRLIGAVRKGGLALTLGAAFIAWTAASALWSPDAGARHDAGWLAATAIGGALFALAAGCLSPLDRTVAQRAGAVGIAVLFAFVTIEAWFNFPIARALTQPGANSGGDARYVEEAQRALQIALVCLGGAVALLAPLGIAGRALAIALICASVSLSGAFGTLNNIAAVVCGAGAAALALIWPRATISILAQVAAGWIVVSPILMPALANLAMQGFRQAVGLDAPFAWQARAEGWAYMAEKMREHALWGWGFGASGHFSETYSLLGFTLPYIPRHPHSGPLQIWLETGAIGAMLAAGALASFGRRAGAALAGDRWAAAGAGAALATGAVLVNVSAGAWSLWWWSAIAVSAGLVRLARRGT